MPTLLTFFLSFCSGYTFFLYFSHPQKKKNALPAIKFKNIEILPNVRIHFRNTTYHLHHWLLLGLFTVTSFFFYEALMQYALVKGVAMGGMLQGLRYKDRFSIRYPRFRR